MTVHHVPHYIHGNNDTNPPHGPSWTLSTACGPALGPFYAAVDPHGPYQQSVGRPMDPSMSPWTLMDPFNSLLVAHVPFHEFANPHGPFHESVGRPMGHFTSPKAHSNNGRSLWTGPCILSRVHGPSEQHLNDSWGFGPSLCQFFAKVFSWLKVVSFLLAMQKSDMWDVLRPQPVARQQQRKNNCGPYRR